MHERTESEPFFKCYPPATLPVLEKTKSIYKNWIPIHRKIPRTERFGLGIKIDNLFIELLEILRKAMYAKVEQKIILLDIATGKIDMLRFFTQFIWEARLISNEQFAIFGKNLEEIGRDVGGWKKGLIRKTSPFVVEK